MKIYKKHHAILLHSIEPNFFDHDDEIVKNYITESRWQLITENNYKLDYQINYTASNPDGSSYFVKHERKLTINCVIDNIEIDMYEIVKIKEAMHLSMGLFLKKNTLSFFDRLSFKPMIFSEFNRIREIEHFSFIDREKYSEEKTVEKELGEILDKHILEVNLIRHE